ncbi:Minor extracellular protease vpr OS=Bacillus subtilis (strain 168) GN=vpr PE=1 SV=1 [Rhizoctonia solani AG-1 IB]|uniref:Minor extracellular protease vpr n=1 Tax=Thanatephorus cucumeris (strain AG1-IB / isolate 7/3/14) TaxID=1108050 RepID=A0A0B7FKY5_THACB|nr:Minor extracellular protease vpr OS=Bacillus subtilis (strain 168) GN=vpr PE=1 SV=1 [Rhizoctonia solani AG-1 IB]
MRLLLFVAAIVQLVIAEADITTVPHETSSNIVPGAYIVELSPGSSIKRGFASPHAELYHDLARRGALWEVTREFSCDVMTGVALKLGSDADLLKVAQSDGVQSIVPVYSHSLPDPIDPQILSGPYQSSQQRSAQSSHVMTGVDKLHAEGTMGKGITIGIIDSGIDYTHPALGGKFGPGNKVIGGYDFVGDAYRGSSGPAPIPDNDPLDQCNGHGTHVAGIIAADPSNPLNISGVAPDASINSYRIFGCSGTVSDDVILAALLKAYEDKNDVITLSLSSVGAWTSSTVGVVASRISDKGHVVVASAGNQGSVGAWYFGSPGTGRSVIGVASIESTFITIQNATTSTGRKIPYYLPSPLTNATNLPLYATSSNVTIPNDACTALPSTTPGLANTLVVIRRGGCALADKIANARKFGAQYFLMYDQADHHWTSWILETLLRHSLRNRMGFTLSNKRSPQTRRFRSPTHPGTTQPSLVVSSTASLAAPGGKIISTYPVKLGSYRIETGTSAAAPFVAGAAALLLQVRGKTPEVAKSAATIFQNAAAPTKFSKTSNLLETAAHQGAGLIQVYDAIKNVGIMTPSELLLNDTAYFKKSHKLTIKNNGRSIVTYELAHLPAGTANTIKGIEVIAGPLPLTSDAASVSFSPSKLIVLPGFTATATVTFAPPSGLSGSSFPVYSGFIQASGSDGTTLRSTYLGLAASMKDMRVIDNTTTIFGAGKKLPLIRDKNNQMVNTSATFTMQGTDYPLLVYRLVAGAPLLRMDLIQASTDVTSNLRKREGAAPWGSLDAPEQHRENEHVESAASPLSKRLIFDWLFPSKGHTSGGTFAQIPTVGVIRQDDFPARNSRASTTAERGFNTLLVKSFANKTEIPDGSYKILVRALKITGDPRKQEDYEVWTSPQIDIKRT